MEIRVLLNWKKDTKGTHVFEAADPKAPVTSLYVKKGTFKEGPPDGLTLVLTD